MPGLSKNQRRRRNRRIRQDTMEQIYRRWDEMNAAFNKTEVSTRAAYGLSTWVYSAISIIADWLTENEFIVESNGNQVKSGPLWSLVNKPNDYRDQNTNNKFRTAYITELLLSGAVMRVFLDMDGMQPRSQAVFPRNQFTPKWFYDDAGVQTVGTWTKITSKGSINYVDGDTINHNALYNPYHDFEGLSPLTASLLGVNADVSLSNLLRRYFDNNASTGLVFSSKLPLTRTQLIDAQKAFDDQHAGIENAYATKFLGHGLQPFILGHNFDATIQRVLKNLTREEIMTGIFKIPPSIYSGQQPSEGVQIGGGSAIEPEKETFLVNVIMPWGRVYDEEFNSDVTRRFVGDYNAKHDFSNNPILEKRRLERARAAVELIDRGVTLNNTIKWLKLEIPVEPHGDEYWLKTNNVPASVIMKAPQDVIFPKAAPTKKQEIDISEIKKQILDEMLGEIKSLVGSAQFRESVRTDPAVRLNGNGKSDKDRITEIMG